MKKIQITIVLLLLNFNVFASNETNNAQGILDQSHLFELQNKIEKFVTTNGQIDSNKIKIAIRYFSQKRTQYENTLFVNEESKQIDDYLQDWKTAEKKATKLIKEEREGLIAFDEVIRRMNDLELNKHIYSEAEIQKKIGTLGLFIAVTDTILHEHFQYDLVNMIVTLGRNFFRISKASEQIEASNLMLNGKFLTANEIRNRKLSGQDISLINPPNSAFWQNNKVENYDPDSTTWYGEKLFPSPSQAQDFYYNRIGDGTVKIKAHWFDNPVNGKKKKKSITLRLGIEIHSGTFSSHLIRALGFYAIPSTYRQNVRLFLGDVSYEEFLNQLNHLQGETMYDLSSFITNYNKKENYVTLKGVCLEAYPDDERYQKLGPFRTGRNGFDNRREYRSWLMNGALVSLNDTQDKQTRVDVIRKDKNSEWEPIFMVADLGYSMGSYLFFDNMGAVNDYSEKMTSQIGNSVMIWWANGFDGWENYQHTTAADVRWWLRRAKRLSPQQMYRMAINSGFPEPIARLYTIKIQKRINDFIQAFDLTKDVGLYQPESYSQVHQEFPEYVNKDGQVKNSIEKINSSNASFIGPFTTLSEILTIHAQNLLQKQIEKPLSFELNKTNFNHEFDLGKNQLSYDIIMGRKRTIQQNKNKSANQKRFQVKDVYEVSIPIGLAGIEIADKSQNIQTPVSYSYHFRYTYIHSYSDPIAAGKSRFFQSFMPWNLSDVKKQLKTGETLLIESTSGYEIGTLKVESENFFQFEFSPLKWSKNNTEQTLITKNERYLEISTNKGNARQYGSNLNISAGLKFHLGLNLGKKKSIYEIFRMDLNDLNPKQATQINAAFNQALIFNDFRLLNLFAQNYQIISEEQFRNSHYGLFVWDKTTERQVKNIEFQLSEEPLNSTTLQFQPGKMNSHQLFIARQVDSSNRTFGNFWIKDFDFGNTEFVFDLIGDSINKGLAKVTELQIAANNEMTQIEQMEFNIQIRKFNRFLTKDIFQKYYLDFFSKISGVSNLFNYQFADGVKFVSPTEATQTWQINQIAIEKILSNLSKSEQICTSPCQDRFDKIQAIKNKLRQSQINISEKKKLFSRLTDLIQKQLNLFIGSQAQRLNQLLTLVGEENLWLRTQITNIHRTDIPISRNKFDSIYSRPIGKYQGDSKLKQIKKKYYFAPMMDYETIQIDSDAVLDATSM